MKLNIFPFLTAGPALLLACCCVIRPTYNPGNDHTVMNLSGNVLRITEHEYDLTAGALGNPGRSDFYDLVYLMEFNPQGNFEWIRTLNASDSSIVSVQRFTYDQGGRLIKSLDHNYIQNTVFEDRYHWDDAGRAVTRYTVYGGIISEREFGRKGYPVNETRYAGGTVAETSRYRYDRCGKLTREKAGGRTTRYYYRRGILHREVYDKTFFATYYPDGNLRSTNNLIEMNIDSGDGLLREQARAEITATYLYDEGGNWIRRERWFGDRAISLTTREIEYYP